MYKMVQKSSKHFTTIYATLAYWLFSGKGTGKIPDTERYFLTSLFFLNICHKFSYKKDRLPLAGRKKCSYQQTESMTKWICTNKLTKIVLISH